jgi:dTDP-4-amino-4,6-dideoxygalactose transaminase
MLNSGPKIDFIDLAAQRRRLEPGLSKAVEAVIASGLYIGGPLVQELESKLAEFCGARHCITCANGSDALSLALSAWGIGPGHAVFVPAFTFAATAGAVANAGATPVFVDVSADTFNMDPNSLAAAVEGARREGLQGRAVIAVDLFGQPADYERLEEVAREEGLLLLSDAAQSFGAVYRGRKIGTIGAATTTSFYPAKPLGAYGDGGAIFTDDAELAELLRSIRSHGQGSHRYEHVRVGVNSRLDAIQAAILLAKLTIFPEELVRRQAVADRYSAALGDLFEVPAVCEGNASSWAQYTIRSHDRTSVADACAQNGVPTAIHYPIPLSRQAGYGRFPSVPGGTPVAERLADTVLSLPMHPYLEPETQDYVIQVVRTAAGGRSRKVG